MTIVTYNFSVYKKIFVVHVVRLVKNIAAFLSPSDLLKQRNIAF